MWQALDKIRETSFWENIRKASLCAMTTMISIRPILIHGMLLPHVEDTTNRLYLSSDWNDRLWSGALAAAVLCNPLNDDINKTLVDVFLSLDIDIDERVRQTFESPVRLFNSNDAEAFQLKIRVC